MNKQGFTLVELLGVIILLAVIALITIPAISGAIKTGQENADQQFKDNVVLAAKNWTIDNKGKTEDNDSCNVTLATLQNEGYIDKHVKIPSTKVEVDATQICVTIKATSKTNGQKKTYTYNYDEGCAAANICS